MFIVEGGIVRGLRQEQPGRRGFRVGRPTCQEQVLTGEGMKVNAETIVLFIGLIAKINLRPLPAAKRNIVPILNSQPGQIANSHFKEARPVLLVVKFVSQAVQQI